MNPIPNNTDWSATAAWIALAISIIGTIVGPIMTTILTNRHQLKIYQMESRDKAQAEKNQIIRDCISNIGSCVSYGNVDNIISCGKYFHNVYAYVPQEKWPLFDSFYQALIEQNGDTLTEMCPEIIHLLASLLTEELQ